MNRKKSRGSLTIEALLMCPVLVLILLAIVYAGRFTDASFRVHRAADVSARVASQANSVSMISRGVATARADLTTGHSPCSKVDVAVTKGMIGRIVTVTSTVTCLLNPSGLGLLSVPRRVIRARSTEVVDFFSAR
jgi:Flp pilus assembly protein TadG